MTISLALALFSAPADAQDHLGRAWLPEDFPIDYQISDYEEDSLPPGYPKIAIDNSYDIWRTDAECAGLAFEFEGYTELNTGFQYDFHNRWTFDDPSDDMGPGTIAATWSQPFFGAPKAFVKNGRTYDRNLDTDIVFNNNTDFATVEQVENSTCAGEHVMDVIALHELGHALGMAHTCEQNEVCNDPERLEATMHWTPTGGTCSLDQMSPNSLDIQNMESLYGPSASFECSHELTPGASDTIAVGNVPFELKCRMISDVPEEVTGATWFFGDGGTDEVPDGTHTYDEPGNYTVRVCFEGENDVCGEWTHCFRREGYVRACGLPEPSFRVEHVNALTHTLLNETDLSVYGCIFEVQWDIYQDGGAEPLFTLPAWEPQVTFPEPGEYRIVLNVGGPAGTGASELTIDAKSRAGEGYGACNSTGGGVGGALLLPFVALMARRRRE